MSTTTTCPSFKPAFAPYHSTFTTPMTSTKSSSQKRSVRFTFGYNNNKGTSDNSSTRTPTSSSLPLSPTLSFDQHFHKHSSANSHDINEKENSSSFTTTAAPTAPDLIPTRTSSIASSVTYSPTSHAFTPVSSAPAPSSRCSSMNSGISFSSSLNHRTMPRPQHQSTSFATENKNKRSHSPPAASRSPSPAHDLDGPSSKESQMRSAFLSSPPVRSRVTRRKICPIPTKSLVSASSTSLMSSVLASTSKCCPLSAINLDKRRWSNDSTRGLNGMSTAFLLENYDSFPSATSHETKGRKPSSASSFPSKSCIKSKTKAKAVSHHGYLESAPTVSSIEVSSKKRCKTLSLFSFMKRTLR